MGGLESHPSAWFFRLPVSFRSKEGGVDPMFCTGQHDEKTHGQRQRLVVFSRREFEFFFFFFLGGKVGGVGFFVPFFFFSSPHHVFQPLYSYPLHGIVFGLCFFFFLLLFPPLLFLFLVGTRPRTTSIYLEPPDSLHVSWRQEFKGRLIVVLEVHIL